MSKCNEWLPTRGGMFTAFRPEWCDGSGNWLPVPVEQVGSGGVPAPLVNGGISNELELCGYEQAMALAWTFAAMAASKGSKVQVRVSRYEVVYDLKARPCAADGGEA